jgi:hypothetical protein
VQRVRHAQHQKSPLVAMTKRYRSARQENLACRYKNARVKIALLVAMRKISTPRGCRFSHMSLSIPMSWWEPPQTVP